MCLPDIDAFTDAIEELYGSEETRRELGEAGREHVLSSFSWDEATTAFDGFITELAQRENRETGSEVRGQ